MTHKATSPTHVGSENIDLGQTGLRFGFINQDNEPTLTEGTYSQLWFDTGVFVDFAVATVRDLFVSFIASLLKPIDLGSDGSLPLTTVPLVLLGDAPTYGPNGQLHALNRGSGADFTVDRGPFIEPVDNPAIIFLGN